MLTFYIIASVLTESDITTLSNQTKIHVTSFPWYPLPPNKETPVLSPDPDASIYIFEFLTQEKEYNFLPQTFFS